LVFAYGIECQDLPILSKISIDDLRDIESLNHLGESMYPDAHLLQRGMSDLISPLVESAGQRVPQAP
jgi:hypothetical protein